MSRAKPRYFNRELSWMEFNQRVLDEAADLSIPLLERVRFLAISASNLDEFFRVRVGGLQILDRQGVIRPDASGLSPREQLVAIRLRAHRMTVDQYALLNGDLEPTLAKQGLRRMRPEELNPTQRATLRQVFENEIFPILTPIAVTGAEDFPLLANQTLGLAVRLSAAPEVPTSLLTLPHPTHATVKRVKKRAARSIGGLFENLTEELEDVHQHDDSPVAESPLAEPSHDAVAKTPVPRYAVIPFGPAISRMIAVVIDTGAAFILLEDLVGMFLDQFFVGEKIEEFVSFRLVRNADMSVREDSAADLLAGMVQVLDERRNGDCVRLDVGERIGLDLKKFLQSCLDVIDEEVYSIPGPLDLSAFARLADRPGFETLKYEPWPAQPSPEIPPGALMFDVLAAQDLLLFHPYETFDPVVDLIKQAALDPDVLAIKQTLYRTSRASPIVDALVLAATRGKHVTAVVELKARFDEARNIEWARRLEQAGAHVIYGVRGLKTHAKVCIVIRREPQGVQRYVHFGTGNYNEVTARIYSDASLLTCDADLGMDAVAFMNAITGYSQPQTYRKIEAAPIGLRDRLLELIRSETERKKQGQPARIVAKVNSLDDPPIIDALYEASAAGVDIQLNVRGICTLKPGVKKLSENIEVVSIVDRYLEHARILYFEHGGDPRVFLSSADWMPRNLDKRVELLVPVEDPRCRARLIHILETYFADNVKARELLPDGTHRRLNPGTREPVRAQQRLYDEARAAKKNAEQQQRTTFEPHRRVT